MMTRDTWNRFRTKENCCTCDTCWEDHVDGKAAEGNYVEHKPATVPLDFILPPTHDPL